MECKGIFIFKSIIEKEGGTFTNDKGQSINYDGCYILQVDDISADGINERKFKIPLAYKKIAKDLKDLKPYTEIVIEFDVKFYDTYIKLIPINFTLND